MKVSVSAIPRFSDEVFRIDYYGIKSFVVIRNDEAKFTSLKLVNDNDKTYVTTYAKLLNIIID